jgi:GDP-L-fucose synthase
MEKNSKIYVAGHRGLVGSALVRSLQRQGFHNLIYRTRQELDLSRQTDVETFFKAEHPDCVFLAAARVGGIWANETYQAEFIYENLIVQANVMEAAYRNGVREFLFMGSSCIYPNDKNVAIHESDFMNGPLEKTNDAYAIAKIAGIKACDAYRRQYGARYIAVMPTNLYGPNDNYDLNNAHVLPSLLRKFHEAKEKGSQTVTMWGSGTPKREFLYSDDLADACLQVMLHYQESDIINIGYGSDLTIRELAELIAKTVNFKGEILLDSTKKDGTMRKLLDSSRIQALGWSPKVSLEEGLKRTYESMQKDFSEGIWK